MMGLRQPVRRLVRRVKARLRPTALILMYHRVAELALDPLLLAVSPTRFAEHLEVLRRGYRPSRLSDLCRGLHSGSLQPGSVVITFDDGYADNLYQAKPLLQQHSVPATVFVTAGPACEGTGFWWDDLGELFLATGALPPSLRLQVAGQKMAWRLGDAACYDGELATRHRAWNVLHETDPTQRHSLYRQLLIILRPLPDIEQRRLMDELHMWSGRARTAPPIQPAMTPRELVDLCHGDLVQVGAHTNTHPVLSTLSRTAQHAEINTGRERLQQILGVPVAYFAYPFGSSSDFNAETTQLLAEGGYEGACTTNADLVWQGSPTLTLPRMVVRNWTGDQFAARLAAWFGGLEA